MMKERIWNFTILDEMKKEKEKNIKLKKQKNKHFKKKNNKLVS